MTALIDRVVQVQCIRGSDGDPKPHSGSGCLVSGRIVLTAAHLVADARQVTIRRPNGREFPAKLDSRFAGKWSGGLDLAIVELINPIEDVDEMPLAVVSRGTDRDQVLDRCQSIGYPRFALGADRLRDTAQISGQIPLGSRLVSGLLSLQVTGLPQHLPPLNVALSNSEWKGISGAPVVAEGCLVGVVTEYAPSRLDGSLGVTPITALENDREHDALGPGVDNAAEWWKKLGVPDWRELPRLPDRTRQREARYYAIIRDIHALTRPLLDRQTELTQIADFATSDEGYRWLVAPAWAGKTSLLAEAVQSALPGDVDVVAYFVSRLTPPADSNAFLAAVVPQLADVLGEKFTVADHVQFSDLWQRAATAAATARRDRDRHLLLVVDGLDEDSRPEGLSSIAARLPAVAGGHAHVLVSRRDQFTLPSDVRAGHPLRLKSTPQVVLRPHAGDDVDVRTLAEQELSSLKALRPAELSRRSTAVVDVLAALAAAEGPLTVDDLSCIIAAPDAPDHHLTQDVGLVVEAARRSLYRVGSDDLPRYQFGQQLVLERAQADPALGHARYTNSVHQWADQWAGKKWPRDTPHYLLENYPGRLYGDAGRLGRLVSEPSWVMTAIRAIGVDRVLATMTTARSVCPKDLQVGALLAAVRGQASSLRQPVAGLDPAYLLRQLCLQAEELGESDLAEKLRDLFGLMPEPGLVPRWTSHRAERALVAKLDPQCGFVRAVSVSPMGWVAGGGQDGRVWQWDPGAREECPQQIGHHAGEVRAVIALPDGRIASGGDDRLVRVWDPARPGIPVAELGPHVGAVTALALDHTGRLISGGHDGRVLRWSWAPGLEGQVPRMDIGHRGHPVRAIAVLPDDRIATGGELDGRVLVWRPGQWTHAAEMSALSDASISALAFSAGHDSRGRLIAGNTEGDLYVWDPDAHQARPSTIAAGHDGSVGAVAALPDGRVISGGEDGRIRAWDPAMIKPVAIEIGEHDRMVSTVAVFADGKVVTGGDDGYVKVWDPAAPGDEPLEVNDEGREIRAMAVFPDGRVVTGGQDGWMRVWKLERTEVVADTVPRADDDVRRGAEDDPARSAECDGPVACVAVRGSQGSAEIVSATSDGALCSWFPDDETSPIRFGSESVAVLSVFPDGPVVTGGYDGRVLLWDSRDSDAAPTRLGLHDAAVVASVCLPDGRLVTAGMDRRVLVWHPNSPRKPLFQLGEEGEPVKALVALPDGRIAGGGEGGKVLLWRLDEPGARPEVLGAHDGWVTDICVLPDARVVSAGTDERVRVWNPSETSGQLVIACSAQALACGTLIDDHGGLLIAHPGSGMSLWKLLNPIEAAPRSPQLRETGSQSAAVDSSTVESNSR